MTLTQLQYVVAIAETKSMYKAASSLFVSQPALNGGFYVSVPLDTTDTMTIGYIKRKNIPLSLLGKEYIEILKSYK